MKKFFDSDVWAWIKVGFEVLMIAGLLIVAIRLWEDLHSQRTEQTRQVQEYKEMKGGQNDQV